MQSAYLIVIGSDPRCTRGWNPMRAGGARKDGLT